MNPAIPKEGMARTTYLEAKFGSLDAFHRLEERVVAAGRSEQISFAFERITRTPNTFSAHRLIWYAGWHGCQDLVMESLFKGYFEEGADLGSYPTLTRLTEAAGLDTERFLESNEGVPEVKAEEAEGHRLGIRAVPYFVFNNSHSLSGAQPVEIFVDVLEKIHGERTDGLVRR